MKPPENCMDCPHHVVVGDPDPYDSFCDDDEAVLCKLSENVTGSKRHAERLGLFEHRPVTVSCRPYRKREECGVPKWCPLKKEED